MVNYSCMQLSLETLNMPKNAYGRPYIKIPMKWTLFGKEIVKDVEVQINDDGSFDTEIIRGYNAFFPKLQEVISANTKLILKAINEGVYFKDAGISKPYTVADIKNNFLTVSDLVVHRENYYDAQTKEFGIPKGSHVTAVCALEWKPDGADGFDTEHGDQLAWVDGKFVMGKPGDFY